MDSAARVSVVAIVVAAALLTSLSTASGQSLRINSPRGGGSNIGNADSAEVGHSGGDVLIKLPTDLKAVLDLQKADRRRIHASILGLHPNGGDGQEVRTTMK